MQKITCGTGVGRINLKFYGFTAHPDGNHLSVCAKKEELEKLPGVKRVEPTHHPWWQWVWVDSSIYQCLKYIAGRPEWDGTQTILIDGKILK